LTVANTLLTNSKKTKTNAVHNFLQTA